MINSFKKLYRWVMYKDDKTSGERCLRVLILLAILLFVVRPLILLFAFLVLSAPLLFTLGICAAIIFSFASLFSCFIFKKTRTQALKAARIIFFSLVAFWAWAFALPFAITSMSWQDVQMVSSRLQFPLSMVNGIAVDNQERIYCSMPPYQRLQLYDNNGGFIRGWFAPIAKKAMGLRLVADANDNLNVISVGGYYIYDPNGRLLSADTDYSEKRFGNYPKSAEDKKGNIYSLEGYSMFSLYPKVLKTTPQGKQSVIIIDSLPHWLIKAPLPSWYLLGISIFLAGPFVWMVNKLTQPESDFYAGAPPEQKVVE